MRTLLERFTKSKTENTPPIVIVSGLPRSGTSMMMAMLEAGGLSPLTDRIRAADDDNPRGYYEFERVKRLDKGDAGWLGEATGKAVKVISALLVHLPPGHTYRVLYMQRRMAEVLESQAAMLTRRGEETDPAADDSMAGLLAAHVEQTLGWLAQQPNFQVLTIDYNRTLADAHATARWVNAFLDGRLDEAAMAAVVDGGLYRNRVSQSRTDNQ